MLHTVCQNELKKFLRFEMYVCVKVMERIYWSHDVFFQCMFFLIKIKKWLIVR